MLAVFSLLITFKDCIGQLLKAQVKRASNLMTPNYKKMQLFLTVHHRPMDTQMGLLVAQMLWNITSRIIKRSVEAYSEYLPSNSYSNESNYIDDLAFTLAKKRTLFPWKSFVVAGSLQELIQRLPDAPRMSKHTRKGRVPKIGFVFTGQGAQWHAMGRELLLYPIFRRSLEDASNYLDQLNSPWHLLGKFP